MNYLALAAALSRLDMLEARLNRLYEALEEPFGPEDGPDSDYRVLQAASADVVEIRAMLAGIGGA